MDHLTTGQWMLQLLTHVTLATLSMETPLGLVGVVECGVDHLQLVLVCSAITK